MKYVVLCLMLALAVTAEAQITRKVQFTGNATTTWASKDFASVGETKQIRGYLLINDSATSTDTIWVGHQFQSSVIDTSSSYRTPVKGGESFGLSGVLLNDIWLKSASGTVPYRLVIY